MTGTYCNICGKKFKEMDFQSGGYIHDDATDSEDFDLCPDCFEKVLVVLTKHCKIQPFQDVREYETSDDSSDFDFDGELNK